MVWEKLLAYITKIWQMKYLAYIVKSWQKKKQLQPLNYWEVFLEISFWLILEI